MYDALLNASKNPYVRLGPVIFFFWFAQLSLEYTYFIAGAMELFPGIQYVFFGTSLMVLAYLLLVCRWQHLSMSRYTGVALTLSVIFLAVGTFMSADILSSIRLWIILGVLTITAALSAVFLYSFEQRVRIVGGFLIFLPFVFPPVVAILIEFAGIFFGVGFNDTQNFEHSGRRWRLFNSSANGFGFDAAIALFIGFVLVLERTPKPHWKHAGFILLLVGLYALYESGTRATMIFALAMIFGYLLMTKGILAFAKITALLIASSVAVGTIASFVTGISAWHHLRLHGDIERISSGRWEAYLGLINEVKMSPLSGYGFGAIGEGFFIYPNNLFYPALAAEIGVIGAIGGAIILFYPAVQLFLKTIVTKLSQRSPDTLTSVYCSFMIGFPLYQFFEFNVLRVSVYHLAFAFAWSWIVFNSSKALQPSANGSLS